MTKFWASLVLGLVFSANLLASEQAEVFQDVTGFEYKRGLFLGADLGVFFVFGGYQVIGYDDTGQRDYRQATVSNVEPYIGLTLGYDVWDYIALGIRAGNGYVSNNTRQGNQESPTDFGLTIGNLVFMAKPRLYDRLVMNINLQGGISWMRPEPVPKSGQLGWNLGLGLGLRYDTLLPGMVIGVDVNGYWMQLADISTFGLPGLIAMSVTPVIEYVF